MVPAPTLAIVPVAGLPDLGIVLAPLVGLAIATVLIALAVLVAGLAAERRDARARRTVRGLATPARPTLRPAA